MDFERRVLFTPGLSPVIGQFVSMKHVLRTTLSGKGGEAFIAPGPWRNEARPASIEAMLQRSIDLNVVNLWWIRLPFFLPHRFLTLACIIGGGLGCAAISWLSISIWRDLPED